MVSVRHSIVTGAPADPKALVDGPAWDDDHVVENLTFADIGGNISNSQGPINPFDLYVSATGSDTGSGLSQSDAFLTVQAAVNAAFTLYDLRGSDLTINIGSGTFAGFQINGLPQNSGNGGHLVIVGSGSSNTTISSSVTAAFGADVRIGSMYITDPTVADIVITNGSTVTLADGDIALGPSVTALVYCINSSSFRGNSNFGLTIAGSASYAFLVSTNSVVQLSVGATYTITGSPTFSVFVDAIVNSSFNPGVTSSWSGTCTAMSYALSLNSSIDMEQSPNPLPGTGYGYADYSSAYYGVPNTTNGSYFQGLDAGFNQTTGTHNTGVGNGALNAVTTSSNSTAFGYQALQDSTAAQNDAFGASAGLFVTTSTQNVAFGAFSLGGGGGGTALTGTGNNTAIGNAALTRISGGAGTNTAVGSTALSSVTTTSSNTAVGYASGANTTGSNNSFFGTDAGQWITSGSNNVAVGFVALQGSSGSPITGSNNVAIGRSTNLLAVSDTNSIIIGDSIAGLGSNSINIGGIFKATGISTPATSTATIPKTLALGTQQTTQGVLTLNNTAAGAFAVNIQSSNSATATWSWTLPTAAPTANSVMLVSTGGVGSWLAPNPLTNSLGANVALNNTANYFDGPTVANGAATGLYFASGCVSVFDATSGTNFGVKLWDGTNVAASAVVSTTVTNQSMVVSVSGLFTNPAGNIKISVRDFTTTTGIMQSNASGNSKDCTLTVYRVA